MDKHTYDSEDDSDIGEEEDVEECPMHNLPHGEREETIVQTLGKNPNPKNPGQTSGV